MTRLVPSLRDPHIFLPAYREVLQSLRNGLHLQSTQSHQARQATDAECSFYINLIFSSYGQDEISELMQQTRSNLTMSVNQKKNLKLQNSSGKITWSILSGKKCVSIKKSGSKTVVVTANQKGTAVIQAKNKGKKFTCIVTVKSRQPSGGSQKEEEVQMRMVIRAGGKSFPAVLYNNEAAAAVWEKLPMTFYMSEMNGNEKYYFMDEELPVDASVPEAVHEGDLMLYGSDCLVLFYKDFRTSYRYTPLGRVENPSGIAKALGTGDVQVVFERAELGTTAN